MVAAKKTRWIRWVKWALLGLGAAFVVRAAWHFPWSAAGETLLRADLKLLLLAALVNPISILVKGWAWHLLLKPVAPHRWKDAQEANWIGAAVNNFSISVAGEATRVHRIVQRARVPLGKAVASVAWTRLAEGIALAMLVLIAPSLLRKPMELREIQLGAAGVLALIAIVLILKRIFRLPTWLPRAARSSLSILGEVGRPRRLAWPVCFGLLDWAVQWATFHLVLVATHAHPSLAASFMAMLATNIGGAVRMTPANVGVFQVTMAVGLVPFGIAPEQAVAAGLALQAVQIPPVTAIGALCLGWRGIRELRTGAPAELVKAIPEAVPEAVTVKEA